MAYTFSRVLTERKKDQINNNGHPNNMLGAIEKLTHPMGGVNDFFYKNQLDEI
jgi:hypothetical protein